MTDKLEDTSLRLRDEMDLYRKMMEKLKENRLQFQKEKEAMQEVGGLVFCCPNCSAQSVDYLVPVTVLLKSNHLRRQKTSSRLPKDKNVH